MQSRYTSGVTDTGNWSICDNSVAKVQTAVMTSVGPHCPLLVLAGNLGIMTLHLGKPKDYQVLHCNSDNKENCIALMTLCHIL